MTSESSDLITSSEVAERLGVTAKTVGIWARKGTIPTAVTTIGGHRRFRWVEIEAAIADDRNAA